MSDHDHSHDLNTIIINKTLTALSSELDSGEIGRKLASTIMQDIGNSIVASGQQINNLVQLQSALTTPKQLEDGSAIFLFPEYRKHVQGYSLLLVAFPEDWDHDHETVTIVSLAVNEKSLKDSNICQFKPEHRIEILRQLHELGAINKSSLYALVFLAKDQVPESYEFLEETEAETINLIEQTEQLFDEQLIADVTSELEVTDNPVVTDSEVILQTEAKFFDELPVDVPVILKSDPNQENWKIATEVVRVLIDNKVADMSTESIYQVACERGFVGNHEKWSSIANIVVMGILEHSNTLIQDDDGRGFTNTWTSDPTESLPQTTPPVNSYAGDIVTDVVSVEILPERPKFPTEVL